MFPLIVTLILNQPFAVNFTPESFKKWVQETSESYDNLSLTYESFTMRLPEFETREAMEKYIIENANINVDETQKNIMDGSESHGNYKLITRKFNIFRQDSLFPNNQVYISLKNIDTHYSYFSESNKATIYNADNRNRWMTPFLYIEKFMYTNIDNIEIEDGNTVLIKREQDGMLLNKILFNNENNDYPSECIEYFETGKMRFLFKDYKATNGFFLPHTIEKHTYGQGILKKDIILRYMRNFILTKAAQLSDNEIVDIMITPDTEIIDQRTGERLSIDTNQDQTFYSLIEIVNNLKEVTQINKKK